MTTPWNEEAFSRWQTLRKELKQYKRAKEYKNIIDTAKEIIEISKRAESIKIMEPLFYKEIGMAHEKMGEKNEAIENYRLAAEGFAAHRKFNEVNKSDDFLKDIQSLEKKIRKLCE